MAWQVWVIIGMAMFRHVMTRWSISSISCCPVTEQVNHLGWGAATRCRWRDVGPDSVAAFVKPSTPYGMGVSQVRMLGLMGLTRHLRV